MDLVLNLADKFLLTPYVYPASWSEDMVVRQFLSLLMITIIGGGALYLSAATLSYYYLFDKRMMEHPQFLPNQVWLEITTSLSSVPGMSTPTAFCFLLEVHGYSRLYDNLDGGIWTLITVARDVVAYLFFTDMGIYWIHRGLHHRLIYKHLHKLHHTLKVPTPFASHAFNPIDGFVQSIPYHVYPFLFPLNKVVYLALFAFVNLWTVSIHDGQYSVPNILKPYINGASHHTDHHQYFNYNYGQYFTLWDRLGSTFKEPSCYEGRSLVEEAQKGKCE